MAKNAVQGFSWSVFVEGLPPFKRQLLLFDKIYVARLDIAMGIGAGLSVPSSSTEHSMIKSNLATVEFLVKKDLIRNYSHYSFAKSNNSELVNLQQELQKLRNQFDNEIALGISSTTKKLLKSSKLYKDILDFQLRIDAIALSKKNEEDFIPIVKSVEHNLPEENKKTRVVKFILNAFPEPDENTSWEHILEFKSDDDVKNKRNALIHWINKVSSSPTPLNDVKEEYEYLYSDYMKHYKLHKMKSTNTTLEIVVTAGSWLLLALQNPQFILPFKDLLRMNLSYINLMQEEEKLPGKEIAYIYHANKEFGNK